MRSANLFAVTVLALILAASSFSPVAVVGGIQVEKVTTNGDETMEFGFEVSGKFPFYFELHGGEYPRFMPLAESGEVTIMERVPDGWVLTDVDCEGLIKLPPEEPSTFGYIPGEGVIITFVAPDYVICTFTNSPAPPVGGVVIPVNTFALISPWLAVIGLVGCIGTVVIVAKKRR